MKCSGLAENETACVGLLGYYSILESSDMARFQSMVKLWYWKAQRF
jgi:hypothetical protein